MKRLLGLEWKKFRRSPFLTTEIAKTVVLGLLFLYFALIFIGMGIAALPITKKVYEGISDLEAVNIIGGFVIYYFLIDLLMRFMMQQFPMLDIKNYLLSPIKKSKLARYVLNKSILHYFNVFTLLFAIPFTIMASVAGLSALWYFLFLLGGVLFNHFAAFFLTSRFDSNPKIIAILIASLILCFYLDYQGYFNLRELFSQFWAVIFSNKIFALIPLALSGLFYFLDFDYLRKNLYLQSKRDSKDDKVSYAFSTTWLDSYGTVGKLMGLELKLILRNKRSRTFFWMSLMMIAYPLIFIGNPVLNSFTIFISLFITGIFALNYGQLILAWNGDHFDLLMSRNIKIQDIFLAKYYIMAASCLILLLPAIMYGFMHQPFFYYTPVMAVFNIGVTIFIYMLLACFKSKRIDLQKGGSMNYEGLSVAHFLIMIPVIGIPYLIINVIQLFSTEAVALAVLGVLGLLGFIFHKNILNTIVNLFLSRKYEVAQAFRKDG